MAKNPYTVLGVAESASQDEIKSTYRKLAKQYHPDLHPGDASCAEKMNEINEAYNLIGDADKRARYDASQSDPFASYSNPYSYNRTYTNQSNPYSGFYNSYTDSYTDTDREEEPRTTFYTFNPFTGFRTYKKTSSNNYDPTMALLRFVGRLMIAAIVIRLVSGFFRIILRLLIDIQQIIIGF